MKSVLAFGTIGALILMSGCAGIESLIDTRTVGIEATPTAIAYGQTSTVKWVGPKADRINGSNFGVSSSQLNGEITDAPPITTTYIIEGNNEDDGHDVQVSVTVTVDKSTKRILLIGDVATPEVPQIKTLLESVSTQAVSVSLALPADLSAFDCIVLHATGSIGTVDANKVRDFMATGKSAVVLGTACRKLATGDASMDNISAIGSWFGGATNSGDGSPWGLSVRTGNAVVPLSSVSRNFDDVDDAGWSAHSCYIQNPGTNCDVMVAAFSDFNRATYFAYKPTTGGKLVYGASAAGSAANIETPAIFLSSVMWCLEGA